MPNRKLTYSTAQKIKQYSFMISAPKIKEELKLDCSLTTIEKIRRNVTYKTMSQVKRCKLSREDRIAIRSLFTQGRKREWIAVKFDVSAGTVSRILRGKRSYD